MGRHRLSTAVLSLWLGSVAWSVPKAAAPQVPAPATAPASEREVLDRYCVSCHNHRLKTSGLSLEKLDVSKADASPDVWENVVRKLQARSMPPQGARRPDEATYRTLEGAIETRLDAAAAAHPTPGAPILHRLNRSEYANAIRDLLALDVDVTSLLPPDDSAYGFDNISDVLGVSPSLQERYLSAAVKIAAMAVGDPDITAGSDTFRIRQDLSQDQHIEGLPLGTIGGTVGALHVPARRRLRVPGEAVSHEPEHRARAGIPARGGVRDRRTPRLPARRSAGRDDLAALFDKPTDTGDAVDARLRVRVPVTAGPHDVSVAFVEDPPRRRSPTGCSRSCAARSTTSTGPGGRTCRRSRSPVRSTRRARATRRAAAGSSRAARRAPPRRRRCAERILSTLARRAYRGAGRADRSCSG